MKHRLATAFLLSVLPFSAAADGLGDVVEGTLRPGWRTADGTHVAALHLRLAPGWKTYWRAPGDAGIPPVFDWSASRNVAGVAVNYPAPKIFRQSGMRSVGYSKEVVLPLTVSARGAGDIALSGRIEIGVCHDVCLPATLAVSGTLPSAVETVDPVIAAALAERPFSEEEAGVGTVRCAVSQDPDGALALRAEIEMPRLAGDEHVVVETRNPAVWVAEPEAWREGGRLVAETRLIHGEAQAFALDRSGVRITVLGDGQAVDIQGCSG